jgi:cellulose synthase/poly-beta-1,6-N-acetylglucosamine synthase-like glycosyltransferase
VSVRAGAFWASSLVAGWVVAGYPALLALLPRRPWEQGDEEPSVTIVVPGYRELEDLPAKLRALDSLDYPREKLQVVVVSDGNRELAELAAQAKPDAEVVLAPERGGKARALNMGLERARGDVVLMTDANNVLEPHSVRAAMRHFADPAVWAVAGQRGEAGSPYDRYEDLLRRLETRSGSVAAMSGDFMAFRRERVPPLADGVVNDDLWLLCQIVRDGGRVIYEPAAASTEPALDAPEEVARRARMGAGRAMLLAELRGLPPGFALRLVSHKFGRLALPFLMLAMLGSSLALARRPAYRAALVAQLSVYALGGLSAAGVDAPGPARVLSRAARQLLVGNVAVAIGAVRGLRGRQPVRWQAVR